MNLLSVWILGDQLLEQHPALQAAEARVGRAQVRVVLIESSERLRQLPYQRKKLVLILSAMRHYAEQLRAAGYLVDYLHAPGFLAGLQEHVARVQPAALLSMQASEFATRQFQSEQLAAALGLPLELLPNTQLLCGRSNPLPSPAPGKRVLLEHFYRSMRRQFQVLLDSAGNPLGGQWNYDKLNRERLPRDHRPLALPQFEPDQITRQVIAEVAQYEQGVGSVHDFALAVTHTQARSATDDFLARRLAAFGPYEDAMSSQDGSLYHSQLSAYLNIGLLEPLELIRAAEQAYHHGLAPINSVEGFIRQILGWREFIYWQYWQQMPELWQANAWQAGRPMPQFFWSGETELRCLSQVIKRLIASGYNHHIERLMLICNFCLLAGIDPAQVAQWFLELYVDAYEWVVLPNVIGMGLNADGGRTATKPYLASANYINTMSDFCAGCRYNPRQRSGPAACPFNLLYWNFLLTHETRLRANPRLGPAVLGLSRISPDERAHIRQQAQAFLETLG